MNSNNKSNINYLFISPEKIKLIDCRDANGKLDVNIMILKFKKVTDLFMPIFKNKQQGEKEDTIFDDEQPGMPHC